MDETECGRGRRQGINGRSAGEERRGEGGEVQRTRERCVVPPGGSAADGGRPGKDRDCPCEKFTGEAVRGERGFWSSAAAPAGWSRVRLVTSRVVALVAVGMPAVGVATPTLLRCCVRRAGCRGRARGRRSPPGATTAVVVCDRSEQPGRQMHDQAQGHEAATHCASLEHGARGD